MPITNRISILTTFEQNNIEKLNLISQTSKKLSRAKLIELAVVEWFERNKDKFPNILMSDEEKAKIDVQIAREEMENGLG